MNIEGWAVHKDGVAHLFLCNIDYPMYARYWAVCGFGAASYQLTRCTEASPQCPVCAELLWRRQIDTYGWAAMCGDGDPQFPSSHDLLRSWMRVVRLPSIDSRFRDRAMTTPLKSYAAGWMLDARSCRANQRAHLFPSFNVTDEEFHVSACGKVRTAAFIPAQWGTPAYCKACARHEPTPHASASQDALVAVNADGGVGDAKTNDALFESQQTGNS